MPRFLPLHVVTCTSTSIEPLHRRPVTRTHEILRPLAHAAYLVDPPIPDRSYDILDRFDRFREALEVHEYGGGPEAQRLVELRDRWLNPPEWVEWVDEPVPGYPTRPVPRDEDAAKALKKRTLTNLYNTRPQWLADAHGALDAAVAAAYTGGRRISPTTTCCASCWR